MKTLRDLKYDKPQRMTHSSLSTDHASQFPEGSCDKSLSVLNPLGVVVVYSINWKTNSLPQRFTVFTTIKDGLLYRAWLNDGVISDKCIKWLVTHFLKTINKI